MREGKKMVVDVRKKIELVEGILHALKEKISQTSSYLKLIVESAEAVTHFIKGRNEDRGDRQKKERKKKS